MQEKNKNNFDILNNDKQDQELLLKICAKKLFQNDFFKIPKRIKKTLNNGALILYFNLLKMIFTGEKNVHDRRIRTTYQEIQDMLGVERRQVYNYLNSLQEQSLIDKLQNLNCEPGTVIIMVKKHSCDEELVPVL